MKFSRRNVPANVDFSLPAPPPAGSTLAEWKAYVQDAQSVILEKQRSRVKGAYVAAAQTQFCDTLVSALLRHTEADFFRRYPRGDTRLAFVAQGGYGRGEMSPRSDLDLLFVYPQRATPYVEFVSEKMLYTLWDLGFQVGHATRSLSDCVKFGEQDVTVRTALLDHRFVAGDRELFDELSTLLKKKLLYVEPSKFVREKLLENELRHERFGNSTNVVEPHVKEGEGGMRDLHTALWASKVRFRVEDFHELFQKGLLPRADLEALERGWDFLLRVRHELHLRTGKKHDVINFELMAPIAEALGFKERKGTLAAEAFMQRYYYHARMILHVSRGIWERCSETSEGRFRGTFGRLGIKDLGGGFRAYRGELIVSEKALQETPGNIMQAFRLSQKHRIPFSRSGYELLRRASGRIRQDFRKDPDVNQTFVDIMGDVENVSDVLLRMNDSRVLGQYVPEFGKLFCRMQYQLYHRYTVDVHSCFCVREVERLFRGDPKTPEFYRSVASRIKDRPLMMMAALFHDIGKGRGQDHSILGAELIKRVGKRMGLDAGRIERLSLLVRHHLTMNNIAQRRDLHDPATINEFAQEVGDAENLDMLYILSYGDTRAVGPGVWNDWKSSLLTELYERTRWVLETGDFKGKWLQESVRKRKKLVLQLARDEGSELPVEMLMQSMPARYFMNNEPEQVIRQLELLVQLGDQPYLLTQGPATGPVAEVFFLGHDQPGLFSIVSGSFRACDMTIIDAQVNTLSDGRVLDVYRVASMDTDFIPESRWQRLREVLSGALSGKLDLAGLIAEKRKRPSLLEHASQRAVRIKQPRVEIDNGLTDRFTIIDIFAYDRMGLLYEITGAFAALGLTIHIAKVATAADMVADVFYVSKLDGSKLEQAEDLAGLRSRLFEIIREDQSATAPS